MRTEAQKIVDLVAELTEVPVESIREGGRVRTVSYARGACCVLLGEFTHLSQTEIGEMVGAVDHSSVAHWQSRYRQPNCPADLAATVDAARPLLVECGWAAKRTLADIVQERAKQIARKKARWMFGGAK